MRVSLNTKNIKSSLKLKIKCSSSSPLEPKPLRDAAEVALDSADDVDVLNAGATAVIDNSGQLKQQGRQGAAAAQQLQPLAASQAEQQGGQGATAAQQLQPLAAKESSVLQRHTCERALREHGPPQRVVLQNARKHAAAAGDGKSRCGAEHKRHALAEHGAVCTTAHPQKLEHCRPALGHSVAGRQRQPLAVPRGVLNAGGGPGVEVQLGELGVVQDAGDEVACGRDRDVVAIL